jgi:hypothetical protein
MAQSLRWIPNKAYRCSNQCCPSLGFSLGMGLKSTLEEGDPPWNQTQQFTVQLDSC